ncbi:hypothetical protein X751_30685 [Mesorhizobium sp. LNJC395A00]|nr:hypothetical protein X751_30685 [Mesorhizobium sp. LNJC395A00]
MATLFMPLMTVLMTGISLVPLDAPALLANQAANLASA